MQHHLSTYYKVLELPVGASESDIKKQYRKLAMHYHPDRNNGDDNHFLAIKEAYEVLIGKKLIQSTSSNTSGDDLRTSRSKNPNRQKTNEERIKEAKQRQKDKLYKEYIENERYFQQLTSSVKWKILKVGAIIGLILTLTIVIESFMSPSLEVVNVVGYSKNTIGGIDGETNASYHVLEDGRSFYAEVAIGSIRNEPSIILVHSPILKNFRGYIPMVGEVKIYKAQFNLGAHSYYLLPFFLLPLFILFYKKRTYTFTLLYHLGLYISCPLLFIYLLVENKWLHLLTLGHL